MDSEDVPGASGTLAPLASTLKDSFRAPERERGQPPQSPAKFPSIKKRQPATAAQDAAQDAAPDPATTTTETFAFQPEMTWNALPTAR